MLIHKNKIPSAYHFEQNVSEREKKFDWQIEAQYTHKHAHKRRSETRDHSHGYFLRKDQRKKRNEYIYIRVVRTI